MKNREVKFYIEKRQGKTENVPIQAHIWIKGERYIYPIGARCNVNQWDIKGQRMFKNNTNNQGQTSSIVNNIIGVVESTITLFFQDHPQGTKEELFAVLREKQGKKPKTTVADVITFESCFTNFVLRANYTTKRTARFMAALKKLKSYKSDISFNDFNPEFLKDFRNHLTTTGLNKDSANYVLKLFRVFARSAEGKSHFKNYPFDGVEIGSENYGTPVYITAQERDHLAAFNFSSDYLNRTRDLFALQCFIGCRVSDYMKMTKNNLNAKNEIQYISGKTKDDQPVTTTVPLSSKALAIINKYGFPGGKLMPFISSQKYNDYLKIIFKEAGLTRNVVVLHKHTKEPISVTLDNIASSHMARRAFVGNLFNMDVKNEVIASMSGHVAGSKAFERYYKIDDQQKIDAIKLLQDGNQK